LLNDFQTSPIHFDGREILCDSADDLVLLREAKILEEFPERVLGLEVGRLQMIEAACRKYFLRSHQRIVHQAIDRAGR